ncbi:MAG: MFS transporter [Tissierellia bacterium]|nr:MFS transporter [Tissierellia bacterium]
MKQRLMFITTFIIQFIIAMEMNFIGPLAPFLSVYFDIRASQVVYFNLGYSFVGIFVIVFGIWADRFGNKKIISYSLFLFLIGSLISGFAPSALVFFLGRILVGLGYFSLSGTMMSYVSEFVDYKNRGKASGILRTAFGFAIFASPIYTAVLTTKFSSLQSIYLPISVLAVVALILLTRLPETDIKENSKLNIKEFLSILKDATTIKVLASLFLIITAPATLYNFLSIHLSTEYGLTQGQIGLTYSTFAIGTILGILTATFLADKYGKLTFSRVFFTIMIIALLPIAYVKSVVITIMLTFMFAFGLDGGWTAYQAFASEIHPKKRSTFMSLFFTVNAAVVTVYSLLGPLLYDFGGLRLTTGIGFVSSLIALIILFRLSRISV